MEKLLNKFHFDPSLNIGQIISVLAMILSVYAWALDTRSLVLQERELRQKAQESTNGKIAEVTAAIKDLDWKLFNYVTNNIGKRSELVIQ